MTNRAVKGERAMIAKAFRHCVLIGVGLLTSTMAAAQTSTPSDSGAYKIGALLQLSGPSGYFGEWTKNGILLAVDDINGKGGINGKKLEVIFRDSKDDPKTGVSEFRKFADLDNVPAVLASGSAIVLPVCPIAEELKILLLNASANSPKIQTDCGSFTFSSISDAPIEVGALVDYATKSLGAKTAGVIHITNDVGVGLKESFVQAFQKLGGKVLAVESGEKGATDFRPQLIKLRAANPDVIFVAGEVNESAQIFKQKHELAIKSQMLAHSTSLSAKVVEVAGAEATQGAIFSQGAFDASGANPVMADFAQRYTARFGQNPAMIYMATFYDGVQLVAAALKSGGNTGAGIQKALSEVRTYEGMSGSFVYNPGTRTPVKPVGFLKVEAGKFVPVKQ